jgi:hypothetical protein
MLNLKMPSYSTYHDDHLQVNQITCDEVKYMMGFAIMWAFHGDL